MHYILDKIVRIFQSITSITARCIRYYTVILSSGLYSYCYLNMILMIFDIKIVDEYSVSSRNFLQLIL